MDPHILARLPSATVAVDMSDWPTHAERVMRQAPVPAKTPFKPEPSVATGSTYTELAPTSKKVNAVTAAAVVTIAMLGVVRGDVSRAVATAAVGVAFAIASGRGRQDASWPGWMHVPVLAAAGASLGTPDMVSASLLWLVVWLGYPNVLEVRWLLLLFGTATAVDHAGAHEPTAWAGTALFAAAALLQSRLDAAWVVVVRNVAAVVAIVAVL